MIYRFNDPYAKKLEEHMLASADFPVYLALACYLLDRIMHDDYGYIY